jgi:hypothetical protein
MLRDALVSLADLYNPETMYQHAITPNPPALTCKSIGPGTIQNDVMHIPEAGERDERSPYSFWRSKINK